MISITLLNSVINDRISELIKIKIIFFNIIHLNIYIHIH